MRWDDIHGKPWRGPVLRPGDLCTAASGFALDARVHHVNVAVGEPALVVAVDGPSCWVLVRGRLHELPFAVDWLDLVKPCW